jgi:hypothetical protein
MAEMAEMPCTVAVAAICCEAMMAPTRFTAAWEMTVWMTAATAIRDDLYGNAGNDTLISRGWNDRLFGGDGNDTYSIESIDSSVARVSDIGSGTDLLRLKSPGADLGNTRFTVDGSDLIINTWSTAGIALKSVHIVDMASAAGRIETLEVDLGTPSDEATPAL